MIDDGLVDMAREIAVRARDEWFEKNGRNIEQQVKELLTKGSDDIIMQILGFERDRWHDGPTWKIDHCNGRSGKSFISEQIAGPAKDACITIVNRVIGDWTPSEQIIQDAKKAFEESVRYRLPELLHNIAHEHARKAGGSGYAGCGKW